MIYKPGSRGDFSGPKDGPNPLDEYNICEHGVDLDKRNCPDCEDQII